MLHARLDLHPNHRGMRADMRHWKWHMLSVEAALHEILQAGVPLSSLVGLKCLAMPAGPQAPLHLHPRIHGYISLPSSYGYGYKLMPGSFGVFRASHLR